VIINQRRLPWLWVEVAPPRGIVAHPLIVRLAELRGIAGVNLTDNAQASIRMSTLVFAAMLKQALDLPLMLYVTCRDRNLIALKADLLGAAALGVEAVVALAGDRPDSGRRTVFEVNTMGLLRVISELNGGRLDSRGALLKTLPALIPGAVANPNRIDWRRELDLLERKAAAGAKFVITQPVFDAEPALRFIEAAHRLSLRVVLGILPIKSAAIARYLKDRIKELDAAASYLDRYWRLSDEQARDLSIVRSLELMEVLGPRVSGFNLMSGGGPSLAVALALEYTGRRQAAASMH
jgi:5,10-methylenetetrahydrofolate reductase